ncbi:TonB-dependent receptor plug domain-containing protein [Mucilaginibacter sp.]|uniref:TonB-dependent receptor plug domain-containing protein n=1 Tax=Mucilaginibacter sp. TaxID=1882438 RepID=UPI002603E31F|nr:TonB-dependent receptor plug domain-containing protein [Mucilaginibacter sp.]MDB5030387.1 hypothetical protein [Mucilaginibacter sp.]
MKNLTYILLLLIGLGAKAQDVISQSNSKLRNLVVSLDSFRNKVPVEKVHIQFDKPFYSLGDTIWMKVYVVNGTNGLSSLSKIMYADLVDDRDSVAINLRIPLTDGLGWGAITLSDSVLSAGNYHIRAYTNLMRNFGPEYFFDRAIRIGNALPPTTNPTSTRQINAPVTKKTMKVKPDTTGSTVQFFPEGGELVNELISKVAFKAVGTDGLSREILGSIVDKDNNELTTFKSEHAGMGTFTFQPAEGNTYTAIVKFADGSEKRYKLPIAAPKGYGLTVTQNDDNIIVNIQASKSLLNTGEISVIAQTNNTVQYTGKKELTRTGFTAVIPKNRFPEGIAQFTLFSPQYQPVAERLVFVKHTDQHLSIKLSPDKPDYKKRDKVHLNMQVTDQDGKPVMGAFSLAITDEGKVPYTEADEKSIFSNLLLTSDLKGYIEQPNYYFTDVSLDKTKQLDNLMLTQGWRRFVWKDILTNNLPNLSYLPEAGMGISGRILTKKGTPAAHAKVSILVNTGNGLIIDTVTDARGRFSFNNFPFSKGTGYNVSAVDAKGKKNITIEIDKKNTIPPTFNHPAQSSELAYGAIAYNHLPEEKPDNNFTTYMDSTRKRFDVLNKNGKLKPAIKLKEVVINARTAKEVAFKHSDSRAGAGGADQELTFVDLANCSDLGACLMGKLTGIRISSNKPGRWTAGYQGGSVIVVVDGQIRTPDYYNLLTPDVIEGIEVIKGARAGNLYGGLITGAIIITTKRGGVDYESYITEHNKSLQKTIDKKKEEKEKAIALKEVSIQEKKIDKVKQIALKDSKNVAGEVATDFVFTFVDLAKAPTLGQFLMTRATGAHITADASGKWAADDLEVIIDGYVRDKLYYEYFPIQRIAAIEVLKNSQINNGNAKKKGSIIITLKKDDVDYQKYIDEHEADQQKAIALKQVNIHEKKTTSTVNIKTIAVKNSQNLAGPGNADQVLTFVDLLPCQSDLSGCLAGRITGGYSDGGRIFIRGFNSPMYVVVDGQGGRDLSSVVSSDIASIEVLRGGGAASLYGEHGSNGVLIISTKKGDVNFDDYTIGYNTVAQTKPKGLITYKLQQGYDMRRQFYAPDYDNPATNKDMADLRSTIYWKPNIVTDENGKASFEFFNADGTGKYHVVAEGLDGMGKLGRQVYEYKVK